MTEEKFQKQFRVSPSKLGDLLQCPKCLWLFYRKGLGRPEGIFPSLPRGMDKVFKDYFDLYRKKGKLPPEIEGKLQDKMFKDAEMLEKWRGRAGLQAEFPEFNMLLKGSIDDLLVSPDGKYVPFDFKSRGYPPKENTHEHYYTQLNLYALLFEKQGLPTADYGYLLFFYPLSYFRGVVNFETELVKMEVSHEKGYEQMKKAYEIISGEEPESHEDCQYCLYRRSEK